MFAAEMEGLKEIEGAQQIRVPKPFLIDKLESGGAFLIMEYIDLKSPSLITEAKVKKILMIKINDAIVAWETISELASVQ